MKSGTYRPVKMFCTICLREFEAVSHHQMETGLCPNCRAAADRRKQKQRVKKKPKTGLTIQEVNTMARAAGMTYGVYVAKMEL